MQPSERGAGLGHPTVTTGFTPTPPQNQITTYSYAMERKTEQSYRPAERLDFPRFHSFRLYTLFPTPVCKGSCGGHPRPSQDRSTPPFIL